MKLIIDMSWFLRAGTTAIYHGIAVSSCNSTKLVRGQVLFRFV
jgi:hypothetical protein